MDAAIAGAASAIFFNQGQACCAGSRLFAHESVFDQVIEGMGKIATSLKMGHGLDPATEMGPLVSQEQFDKVNGYIASGREQGAKVPFGGNLHVDKGYFVQPTVLHNVRSGMKVVDEEIFGPVVVAQSFSSDSDLDRLAAQANDTVFGLAASVWTKDLSAAHKMARRIKAGTVWVNCHNVFDAALPFGGFKQSGWGREMGAEALNDTEVKAVTTQALFAREPAARPIDPPASKQRPAAPSPRLERPPALPGLKPFCLPRLPSSSPTSSSSPPPPPPSGLGSSAPGFGRTGTPTPPTFTSSRTPAPTSAIVHASAGRPSASASPQKSPEFVPYQRLAWHTHIFGLDAYHAWLLIPVGDCPPASLARRPRPAGSLACTTLSCLAAAHVNISSGSIASALKQDGDHHAAPCSLNPSSFRTHLNMMILTMQSPYQSLPASAPWETHSDASS